MTDEELDELVAVLTNEMDSRFGASASVRCERVRYIGDDGHHRDRIRITIEVTEP